MAKKKATARSATTRPAKKVRSGHSKRLDPLAFGIDLQAIIQNDIRPNLAGMTLAEIGQRAGMSPGVDSQVLNGHATPRWV